MTRGARHAEFSKVMQQEMEQEKQENLAHKVPEQESKLRPTLEAVQRRQHLQACQPTRI